MEPTKILTLAEAVDYVREAKRPDGDIDECVDQYNDRRRAVYCEQGEWGIVFNSDIIKPGHNGGMAIIQSSLKNLHILRREVLDHVDRIEEVEALAPVDYPSVKHI